MGAKANVKKVFGKTSGGLPSRKMGGISLICVNQ